MDAHPHRIPATLRPHYSWANLAFLQWTIFAPAYRHTVRECEKQNVAWVRLNLSSAKRDLARLRQDVHAAGVHCALVDAQNGSTPYRLIACIILNTTSASERLEPLRGVAL